MLNKKKNIFLSYGNQTSRYKSNVIKSEFRCFDKKNEALSVRLLSFDNWQCSRTEREKKYACFSF